MGASSFLENMSYDSLQNLWGHHPAWKLMSTKRAPFIISFLHTAFVADNNREIPEYRLVGKLKEYQEMQDQEYAEPKDLLTDWADDACGWLRKFHPSGSDDAHYDLTSAAQKAIEWVESLGSQSFVGTESRLLMVFRLFHEIAEQSDEDPQRRIQELQRRRAELDEEIVRAEQGYVKVLEPVQIKERYLQAMQMSREILVDFREVEQNFRNLRRTMQEKIAGWDQGKGQLLGDFFQNQDSIQQSEQGKSFQAFFNFLLSKAAQDDFEQTIRAVSALGPVQTLPGSKTAHRIIHDWVDGSRHVQDTLAAVSEQLRRYVDESFLLEERRINQIIKKIEFMALSLCNETPPGDFMQINAMSPELILPFDRPLFTPPVPSQMDEPDLAYGNAQERDDCGLYTHVSVDKERLSRHINDLLHRSPEATLSQVIAVHPIELGLAELMGYLFLAHNDPDAVLQPQVSEPILWTDTDGNIHKADFCRVIFRRGTKELTEHG